MSLRVGVVGLGTAGRLHLEGYRADPRAEVVGVADVNPHALRAAAAAGLPTFATAHELLTRVSVDALSICTLPDTHVAMGLEAFERGAAVLCEKPLARSAAEARALVEAAESHGLPLACAFAHRFFPPTAQLAAAVASGRLGRVTGVINRFAVDYTDLRGPWKWDPGIAGGGALLDAATHAVDLVRFLAGEVAAVCGAVVQHVDSRFAPVEDGATLLLSTAAGAFGVVAADWTTPHKRYSLEVYGTQGEAVVEFDPPRLTWRGPAGTEVVDFPGETALGRFRHLVAHFLDALTGVAPLSVTGRDGLRALEIVEAAAAR